MTMSTDYVSRWTLRIVDQTVNMGEMGAFELWTKSSRISQWYVKLKKQRLHYAKG